jgi:hypothetical protein
LIQGFDTIRAFMNDAIKADRKKLKVFPTGQVY